MKTTVKRMTVLTILSVFFLEACSIFASALRTPKMLECAEIPLYIDSEWIGAGYVIDAVPYVPLLSFTEQLLQERCESLWNQKTGTATITINALTLNVTADKHYISANGRYYYLTGGAYNVNGTILVPLTALAKIFSLGLSVDRTAWRLQIDLGNIQLPEPGEEFYDEEDLYWLSRVISAEAQGQPLEGMIGVGAVVINRVKDRSGQYENNIHDVIFQDGQFDVVELETIFDDPVEEAVIAAKLCLEGYNTVGDSLWFVNPQKASTRWFDLNHAYVTTIADHLFYRSRA